MKIKVNNTQLEIFDGATVLDALRVYHKHRKRKFPKVLPTIYDVYGNKVAPDGELTEGNALFIKRKNKSRLPASEP